MENGEILYAGNAGDKPVFLWTVDGARLKFLIHHEDEWLDIHYARSDEPGKMSRMVDALVNSLPFNAVRFIAPLDDEDKERVNLFGDELEKRGLIGSRQENISNDRDIRDVLHDYKEVEDEYYDGERYNMLITLWNTE